MAYSGLVEVFAPDAVKRLQSYNDTLIVQNTFNSN